MDERPRELEVRLSTGILLICLTIAFVTIAGNYIGNKYFWDQYDQTTRLDRELQTTQAQLQKDSTNLSNLIQAGWIYYQKGQKFEALKYYEMVLKQDPNHLQGLYNSGLIYFEQGNFTEAEKRYLTVKEIYPKHLDNLLALGELYIAMKEPDKALENLQSLVDLKSSWTQVHYNLGQAYLLKKMIPEAERSLKEALKYDPNFKPALEKLDSIEGGKND